MKADLLAKLEQHLAEVAAFQKQIKAVTTTQIKKPTQRASATAIARRWFDEIVSLFRLAAISGADLDKASSQFAELLRISKAASAKKTYLNLLTGIVQNYKGNLIHLVEISPDNSGSVLSIVPYLEGLTADEGAYLAEAQRCLTVDGIRACIVMGWCATVSRMHTKIESMGFAAFNKATEDMFAKQFGRFKFFTRSSKSILCPNSGGQSSTPTCFGFLNSWN